MKKWIRHAVVTVLSLLLSGQASYGFAAAETNPADSKAQQKAQFSISVGSAKLGNIFDLNDSMSAIITLKNYSQQEQRGSVHLLLKDYWGKLVAEEIKAITIMTGAEQQTTIKFIDSLNGYFQATATFTPESGIAVSASSTFARVASNRAADMPSSSFFGAQTHFGQFTADPVNNLTLISSMGTKFIRDEMYWSEVEKEKGKFTFDPRFDAYVNEAAKRGIEPLLILDYGNALYDQNPEGTDSRSPHTQQGLEAYARYVKEVASRYKGKIHHYEVWNEPNGNQFWLAEPDGREYAALLKAAYLAVKEVDPQAIVIGGSVSGTDLYFLDDLFAAGGLNYMDALSIHPYRGGSPEYTKYLDDIERHRQLMLKYGQVKKLWITETGYPTTSEFYTPEEQARYVVRTNVLSMSSGIIRMVNWYDFQDDGPDAHNYEHNFGVVHLDLTPKPSFAAYDTMVHLLDSAEYIGQVPLANDQYGYVFLKNGRLTTVLWTMKDSRIELPFNGDYVLTDMLGSELKGTADGRLVVNLKREPVYLQTDVSAGWAHQAASYAIRSDMDKEAALLDKIVKDKKRLTKWSDTLVSVSNMTELGQYLQAKKSIADLQLELLASDVKTILQKDAYAASSSLTVTQQKLSAIQAAVDNSKKSVKQLEQQTDRLAKLTDDLAEGIRKKNGETGRLPATELWIIEVRDRIVQARALLRNQDPATASAVLSYSEGVAVLAAASAVVEPVQHAAVWTSLSQYKWSGYQTITVPVSLHNALNHPVTVTPMVNLPDGIHAAVKSVTLAGNASETVEVQVDGSSVPAGRYQALLSLQYTVDKERKVESVPMDLTLNFEKPVDYIVEPLSESFLNDHNLKFTVRNLLDRAVSGTFSVTLPVQFQSDSRSFTVDELNAGESRTYTLNVRQSSATPNNEYVVDLKGKFEGVRVEASKPLNFEYVAKGTPSIDGDLSDWEKSFPIHLNDESLVHDIRNWTPEKASAVIWTMWDDNNFYLAAKVTDNRFYNEYTAEDLWMGDSIQAAFDTLGDRTTNYDGDDYEYGFSLNRFGTHANRWVAPEGQATGEVRSAKIAVKKMNETTVIYEIAIPKNEITPLTLKAGTKFGMDLLLNDNDEGARLGWLEWTEGFGTDKNPSLFHQWTLVE